MADKVSSTKPFHNHIKMGLAFLFTKEILEEMIQDDTEEFTRRILEDIYTNQSVSRGTTCQSCRISNVLKCPTADICNTKNPKKCMIHQGSSNMYRPCPNKICNLFRDSIAAQHRSLPAWKNTDVTKWCSCAVEIAKCFMPQQGYGGKTSLHETDFHGIISIIINSKRLQNKLAVNLSKKKNLCIQIRNRSNDFRHSPRFATEDDVFEKNLDLLITLLEDPKYLHSRSQTAVKFLRELKNDTFEVSSRQISRVLTDEIKVREEEAVKNISDLSDDVMQGISQQTIRNLHTIRDKLSEVSEIITATALAEITDIKVRAVYEMTECTRKQKASIEKTGFKEQRKLQRQATQLRTSFGKEDKPSEDEDHHHAEKANTEHDQRFKNDLRSHLIELYKREHKNLPISPFIESNKAPILDYYVNPTMYYIDIDRQPFRNEESRFTNSVDSYNDIFRKDDERCQNIYVTSPAGSGKTCFTKRMVLTWCQAWGPEESKQECFESENIKVMKNFSFLFLISLRNCRSNECDVDEMIRNQLLSKLPEQFHGKDSYERLLNSEECLIVSDGLDEWSHPTKKKKKCPEFSSKIPHRKLRLKSTFLTTTRRWKFHMVSQENVQIDQHIEIMGLDKTSSDMLIKKVVLHLNSRSGQSKNSDEFGHVLETKGLQNFIQFPLILIQLLCLWYDGKDPGESKCQIFSNMLELLFRHAARRANFDEKYRNIPHKKGKRSNKLLPSCFSTAPLCMKYRQLLFSLAKLSYETLFGENFDNSLVFDQKVVHTYLSEDEFSLCVETGILLQSKQAGQITSEEFNYSFLHKTFQELLAALFISSKSDLPTNMIPKMRKKVKCVDEVLRMEMFLIFLSGLSPNVMSRLSTGFVPMISKEEMTERYRQNIGTIFIKDMNKMHDLSDLMISCVQESTCNGLDSLVYLEDIFVDEKCLDSKFRSAMSTLIKTNKHSVKSLYLHIHQTVSSEGIETIMEEINVSAVQSLAKLFVWGSIHPSIVESLLKNSANSLKCVELWNQALRPEYLKVMIEMKTVHGLSLMSISLAHEQINDLMLVISRNSVLKQLNLNKIMCSDHENECPGFLLQLCIEAKPQVVVLDKLHVKEVSLNATCVQTCIAELLYKQGALKSLLNCMADAPNLKRFECDDPVDESETDCLISMVPKFVNLNYFRLRNVNLSGRRLNLTNMKDLMRVHIWRASMAAVVFKGIVKDIESLEKSVIVILDNCIISPEDEAGYEREYVESSSKFEVMLKKTGKYPQFHFKTVSG